MKKQYTWSFEKDVERYDNDIHDTIDACIDEAISCGATVGDTIYVGECENFSINVDSHSIFESLGKEAYDLAGEHGEDWGDDLNFPKEDTEKLDKQLTQVITDFLIEHHSEPSFYQVNNIRAVIVE